MDVAADVNAQPARLHSHVVIPIAPGGDVLDLEVVLGNVPIERAFQHRVGLHPFHEAVHALLDLVGAWPLPHPGLLGGQRSPVGDELVAARPRIGSQPRFQLHGADRRIGPPAQHVSGKLGVTFHGDAQIIRAVRAQLV